MSDTQTTLFDAAREPTTKAHARTTDPVTSHDAARVLTADDLRPRQRAVLLLLREAPGHFDDLIDRNARNVNRRALNDGVDDWPKQSDSGLRTRVSELVDAGLARDSGRKVRLPSGRQAIVWEAT